MSLGKGTIVLMGSGELTATMVEVHKELLAGLGDAPQAVFLDTPAGFQLNVDLLSQKATEYFTAHINYPLAVASYKSAESVSTYDAEQALHRLRTADYMLIGPGSPTYAVRQWQQSPIPDIFNKRIEAGGCLVAASAAALTVGRFTLPVYEIYKVGMNLYWEEGMDVLGHFGFNLVVVPHWNNAEGGNHDTRFCYMGEPRFRELEAHLPEDVFVFGLDEHTACIIDLEKEEADVRGIGRVTLRRQGSEILFAKGDRFPLDVLRGGDGSPQWQPTTAASELPCKDNQTTDNSFWNTIHGLEETFQNGVARHSPEDMTRALLELDGIIWKTQQELENPEFISQAREILRDMIVLFGVQLAAAPRSPDECLGPVVKQLLGLRAHFRSNKQWAEADAIRDCLAQAHIVIEDTADGTRWHLQAEHG